MNISTFAQIVKLPVVAYKSVLVEVPHDTIAVATPPGDIFAIHPVVPGFL